MDSKNTIDLNKIGMEQINRLPPKYNPTKIIPDLIQEKNKNTLSRPNEMKIKPSLLPVTVPYKAPSTIGSNRFNPIFNQGIKLAVMPKNSDLPPYTRVSLDKAPIYNPPFEMKEPVSTLSNQTQTIPKIDKFNNLSRESELISIKNENIDMTIPIVTIVGICFILYMRR